MENNKFNEKKKKKEKFDPSLDSAYNQRNNVKEDISPLFSL